MQPPELTLAPMLEQQAQDLCLWRYEPPYDVFNWPSWEQLTAFREEFSDPAIRATQYLSVLGCDGRLSGFAQFAPLDSGGIRLGLGLRPDLCGQGHGPALMAAILPEALRRRAPGQAVELEVLQWNERARRLYAKCGFHIADEYERLTLTGISEFYRMVYDED